MEPAGSFLAARDYYPALGRRGKKCIASILLEPILVKWPRDAVERAVAIVQWVGGEMEQ